MSKRYGGTVALRETTFTVRAGTVHALLGENGAGKSTLVGILTGTVRPDAGGLLLDGTPVSFDSSAAAARGGVAVVSQELRLFPELPVLANLFTLREPRRAGVLLDRARMRREAGPVLAELGLDVDLRRPLAELRLADRQLVEIAAALLARPRILVLDEPTSALEEASTARLLGVVDVLRRRGVGVVYVSHLLEEVLSLSDEVTVLRDGAAVLSAEPRAGLDVHAIVTAMLGAPPAGARSASARSAGADAAPRAPRAAGCLRVRELGRAGAVEPVSFETAPGEILGLAGVVGAGHQAVLELLGGLRRPTSGSVLLPDGSRLPGRRRAVVAAGVATVSGDRHRLGLILDKPLWENLAQVDAVALARYGPIVAPGRLRHAARERMQSLGIRARSPDVRAGALSGGNQQKAVLAMWLNAEPQVLLLDDPTRGVDVGAKAEIHRLIRTLADAGVVVVLCSTDISEVASLCDRVLVFRQGRRVAELAGEALGEHELLEAINALPEPALGVAAAQPRAGRPGGTDLPRKGNADVAAQS
ncbi:MAG: sugar ABC transporter ATP-binding protein [Microbacteriaceae bacterium]